MLKVLSFIVKDTVLRMPDPKIVIVGAGVAGIATASRLLSKGFNDIIILEAENRFGGRVCTVHFGENCVDLGAQWVHGEGGNIVYSIANPLGLLDNEHGGITEAQCFLSNGQQLDMKTSHELYNVCWEILYECDKMREFEGSLGEYFNSRFQEKLNSEGKVRVAPNLSQSFLNWYQKFQNSIDGPDSWFETSARGLEEYWECEGNLLVKWKKGGFSNIIDLLMKRYPNPEEELPVKEKTLFNKEVKSINWEGPQVKVTCDDGTLYSADHVVVTVSLGVLKEREETLFTPELPRLKSNAIKGLGIGTVNKILMKFPHRWWPDTCPGFSLLWELDEEDSNIHDTNVNWIHDVFGFYGIDNNPTVLCGWVVGQSSRHMELCTDEQVKECCQQLLQRFLGKKFKIPQAEAIIRSKWHSNPHFRGSYSFRSLNSEHLNAKAAHLAEPVSRNNKQVLLFAGEATHDHYFSTVHGALETGYREADRIMSLYPKLIKSTL